MLTTHDTNSNIQYRNILNFLIKQFEDEVELQKSIRFKFR